MNVVDGRISVGKLSISFLLVDRISCFGRFIGRRLVLLYPDFEIFKTLGISVLDVPSNSGSRSYKIRLLPNKLPLTVAFSVCTPCNKG